MILSGSGLYYALTAKKVGWEGLWYGYTGLAGSFYVPHTNQNLRHCDRCFIWRSFVGSLADARSSLSVFLPMLLVVASSEVLFSVASAI